MKERCYSLDVLKFVCAILVVILHTNFKYHDAFLPITRCAVPCFLLISGFFLYSDEKTAIGQERLVRNIKHIFHIMLWSTLLYASVKVGMSILHGKSALPSMRQWFNFIVFNDNPFGFHLWYLGAYLYVLVIMLVVDKHRLWKPLMWATPLLLLGDLLFGKYSLLLLHHEYPYVYVRNFLFVGLPYFMIGVWIKAHRDKFLSVSKTVYAGGVILFSCTSVIEKAILLSLQKSPAREHYLSTTFLTICLFMFVLSFRKARASKVSLLGERDSLYIYVFHPLFLIALPMLIRRLPQAVDLCYQWIAPSVILVLTMLFTITLRKIKLIK